MHFNKITDEICNIVVKVTKHESISKFTNISKEPFDDLDRIEIEMAVEEHFNIDLYYANNYQNAQTIFDLAKCVKSCLLY